MILLIDTALDVAHVGLSHEGKLIALKTQEKASRQQGFLHPAIASLMQENNLGWGNIKAVCVVIGPGSYTGLRVGLAAAKGICYVHKMPLIAISTLELMARQAFLHPDCHNIVIPMIDARRMEVFAAAYNRKMEELAAPSAYILTPQSFQHLTNNGQTKATLIGNGVKKFTALNLGSFFGELPLQHYMEAMADNAYTKYINNESVSLSYAEPSYLKEFYSGGN